MSNKLIRSNCLIESFKLWIRNPFKRKIGYDYNSPSGTISFYCRIEDIEYRFRRKIFRNKNKSKIFFLGYRVSNKIEKRWKN